LNNLSSVLYQAANAIGTEDMVAPGFRARDLALSMTLLTGLIYNTPIEPLVAVIVPVMSAADAYKAPAFVTAKWVVTLFLLSF
jgi:hypothetical protein